MTNDARGALVNAYRDWLDADLDDRRGDLTPPDVARELLRAVRACEAACRDDDVRTAAYIEARWGKRP